ncbi:hypothetical protein [Pseudorhodobacter sp.]|nr:hypothetical protein [Pseudorhodobacter sp.]MDN5786395.1 hypothetical protein [Pseudorhodobacter sp.]
MPKMPTEGGSYTRDPDTGVLTKVTDEEGSPVPPAKIQEPVKKGGK